ncbi:MAG: ABC-F family ATP-binding cassette domain-containing protein, partial [bacterium]|nr:ABC-F family ATP-binding cassette domain-containing protein [bacterium]
MSPKSLLNIKDLSVAFVNTKVLEGFSLSVGAGEIVAVLGANGCGKTTILNVLLARQGMNPDFIEKNQVKLGGVIDTPKGLTLSYLPQNLRRDWTPESAGPVDYSLASIEARLTKAIGLDPNAREPKELSDGQLQKLAIVKTLTAEADLHLLDEPTNYLDIDGITVLEDTLAHLRDRGRGVLMVTHDRTLTDNLADKTVFVTQNGIY